MLNIFLTAFDPSDLPGGSIDPLGFERGYLQLADTILPGMTNVASCPRYFGVLCAGVLLAQVPDSDNITVRKRVRQGQVLRFERLWVLANVLAFRGQGEAALSGLRGVTYAVAHADRLHQRGETRTPCDFRLLIRQVPYGAFGIYGAVADTCHLLHRSTYDLTPGLGEPLAQAFLDETKAPRVVRRAVVSGESVRLADLQDWGRGAYLWGGVGPRERRCLSELLHADGTRSRFCELACLYPAREGETELGRLQRMAQGLRGQPNEQDLRAKIRAILDYERCYRLVQLALERLLWLARQTGPAGVTRVEELAGDPVLALVRQDLPGAVTRLGRTCPGEGVGSLAGVSEVTPFLTEAAAGADAEHLARVVLERHRHVQAGKFDGGQRKLPWLQFLDGQLSLTVGRVGGLAGEATSPDRIAAHPYRLQAADNWSRAAGVRA
ncbi:MAG: hypothetical protein ACYC63_00430 [Armatimonadota bacterium]